MSETGLLVVVSGPSGTGKGTVLKELKEKCENVRFSISATTRKPRTEEVDGESYFFKQIDEFKSMIEKDELVEWVTYCDNYYGTPKKYIEDMTQLGLNVILEIEVEGAINIKKKYKDCVSIFILPPSFEELKKRIEGRGTEKADVIFKRLTKAREEIELVEKYDYVIINETVEKAVGDIESILKAEKFKLQRNPEILKHIKYSK